MKRRRRRGQRLDNQDLFIDSASRERIEYWVLTLLISLNGYRDFFSSMGGFNDDSIAYYLGLDRYVDNLEVEGRKEILLILKNRLKELESLDNPPLPKILGRNVKKIMKLINLNEAEKDILVFAIYLKYYDLLDNASRTLDDLSSEKVAVALSYLLDHAPHKVKKALSPHGKLAQSGLVTIDRDGSSSLFNKIDILSREFADRMISLDEDIEEMIRDSVRRCEPALLNVDDFDYLGNDLELLVPYLDQAVNRKKQGVNILFYGRPGTGKTELTKALADRLGVGIYEVSYADENDEPISGNRRLKAYKVAQSFFSNNKVLLMFDEIEDVIGDDQDFNSLFPEKQSNKGWMNRILERNKIPAIWITNDIDSMDPAMVRRFDMSMEIPVPPKAKRKEIIQQACVNLLSKKSIDKIAQNEAIAPALISRAAKVISHIGIKGEESDRAFENILNNTLKAQGYPRIQGNATEPLPKSYDPSFINADADLKSLAKGIRSNPNARLCLYGVPGTGKSAFGKWIASYTDKPFLLKKGSDLISKWVGGTEKNIANAFEEAKDEGAILIFDEVDSFLRDRRSARQSWEVTQVNEMLVQMENFNGIFIATTNLMSGLDQASLRRFDMKLEFGYLAAKQAWKLFCKECAVLGIDIPKSSSLKKQIRSLRQLAPGDFAAVRRQHKFHPIPSAEVFLARLAEEISVKEESVGAKVGFLR
jgi:SpoVK/Ycf46/Vps4 family AAA+-type ATPase